MPLSLHRLTSHLYRRPEEIDSLTARGTLQRRSALFVVLALLLALPLTTALLKNLVRWSSFAADVELPLSQWTALYETTPEPCGTDATSAPRCLANPANPALWEHGVSRADSHVHKGRIMARGDQEYWVGVSITPAQKREALARGANHLVLGSIRSDYRLWVDGNQLISGTWSDSEPLALAIPLEWLRGEQPLRIALRSVRFPTFNDAPDVLENPPRLGLATKEHATDWRRYQNFWYTSRPLAFMALDFLLAWIFFGVWRVAPEKTEYFYIAVMSMSFALFQMRYVDLYYVMTGRAFVNTLGYSMSIVYAFSGMLAGFAFARLREAIMRWALGICLVLCLVLPLLERDAVIQQIYTYYWFGVIADAGSVLGALSCYVQAAYLFADCKHRVHLKQRVRRLIMFGTGLLMLILLNQILYTTNDHSLLKMIFGKSGPFFLLISLGLIALSEYRTQHRLAVEMPVSKFHRLDPLPESVAGVILNVDLKGSERIARLSAQAGHAGDLVESCLSHMWMAVSQNGGLVLQTEGDALRAIFPAGELEDPLRSAFAATETMRHHLRELGQRFVSQGIGATAPGQGLHFRGAIVEGEIRPIWQSYGGTRLAGWVEAGHGNVLIEAARILELERQVDPSGAEASVVVILSELRGRDASQVRTGAWLFDRRIFPAKHGRQYEIAAYQVGEPEGPVDRRLTSRSSPP